MFSGMRGTFLGLICAFPFVCLSHAELDLQEFVNETQRVSMEKRQMELVWWIPVEYWEHSFRSEGMPEEELKEALSVIEEYTVLAAMKGRVGPFGGMQAETRDELAEKIVLGKGDRVYLPLPDEDVSADMHSFLSMVKPVMSNTMGAMGQGIEFFLFAGSEDGERLLDPKEEGSFTVSIGPSKYHWRLPLGSLLPPRVDPDTGERFPGNFVYNPFTGAELETVGDSEVDK